MGASPQQIDDKSVAAVWLFEDGKGKVAKDASGHDNHAEFVNDGIKWVKGKFGKGVQLNGEDQWLTIETEKGKSGRNRFQREEKLLNSRLGFCRGRPNWQMYYLERVRLFIMVAIFIGNRCTRKW